MSTSAPSPAMRANLSSMPNEINYIILNYLDPCSATSLGLACPSIYKPLKELYHHPIGLNQGFCTQSPPCDDEGFYEDDFSDHETSRYYTAFATCSHWISLGHLIQNWSGFAQYRFYNRFPNLFVIKSIYEDVSGSNEERRLTRRYRHWCKWTSQPHYNPVRDRNPELPRPANRGEGWYGEVKAHIAASCHEFVKMQYWWWCWKLGNTFHGLAEYFFGVQNGYEADMSDLWRIVMEGREGRKEDDESDTSDCTVGSLKSGSEAFGSLGHLMVADHDLKDLRCVPLARSFDEE